MQYWNDLWNSAVCKSRRRLLSSNVAGRRYWFRAAAIIVRLRASCGYLRRDARGSFPPRALFLVSGGRKGGALVISLFYTHFVQQSRTSAQLPVHYQKPDRRRQLGRVCSRISEKFTLFPLHVSRRCGWRIFKSVTAQENSCGNKYRRIGGKRVSVCLRSPRRILVDSIFCRNR